MKEPYVDLQVEEFLRKLWQRANHYERLTFDQQFSLYDKDKFQKRVWRLRKFYAYVHKLYKQKQRENSGNYIFKK